MTAPQFAPGQVIAGKYTVRGLMGYCGAAATYVATAAPGRDLVVKLLSPQLADRPDVLGALQHAMAVTNSLPPDATAPVVDSGFDQATRAPFFVTEVVALPSLAQTIERGVLSPGDVVVLLRGVARAVDAAHAQRLVHGALRPQNVFVGPAPQRAVRVIDLGVATVRAALPTAEGRSHAAPWMAPEQLQPGAAGPGADVFAAALVAFFALTGRSYWRSCQGGSPDLADWQQEAMAPRAPASTRARELGASLPPSLDPVLGRALAPDPAARFASVSELAEALASALASAPAPAPYAGPPAAAPGAPGNAPWNAPAQGPAQAVALPAPGQTPYVSEAPDVPRSRTGLWVALVLVGVVVVGGGLGAVVALRGAPPSSGSAPVASGAAPAASPAASAPAASASAASAAPSASAAPVASGVEGAAPEAIADAAADAPALASLTIVCVPECDSINVDEVQLLGGDAGIDDAGLTQPLRLSAGSHALSVGRATYFPQTRKVTLRPGETQKATFFLTRPGQVAAPTKQCGKFLERCP